MVSGKMKKAAALLAVLTCGWWAGTAPGHAQTVELNGKVRFQEFTLGSGGFTFNDSTRVVLESGSQELADLLNADHGVLWKLRMATGLQLSVEVGGTPTSNDIYLTDDTSARFKSLTVTASIAYAATVAKNIGHNVHEEGYEYQAGAAGVTLKFATDTGAIRAVSTLLELVMSDGRDVGDHRSLPSGTGIDYPKYEKRIVHLDVARLFSQPRQILGFLDRLHQYRVNVLHMHLNDDARRQGHPIEGFFRLDVGDAARQRRLSPDGNYYTREDWDAFEAAARRYGIEIVPEFDTPGHASSFVADNSSLPHFINPNWSINRTVLDVTTPAKRKRVTDYVVSLVLQFKPWFKSGKFHIGGDEANKQNERFNRWPHDVIYFDDLYKRLSAHFDELQVWQNSGKFGWQNHRKPFDDVNPNLVPTHWNGHTDYSSHNLQTGTHKRWYAYPYNNYIIPTHRWYGYGTKPQVMYEGKNTFGFQRSMIGSAGRRDGAIPDGVAVATWNDKTVGQGFTYDLANIPLKWTFPAIGLFGWYGTFGTNGRIEGAVTVRYSQLGHEANLRPMSWEQVSFWVRERFPYLDAQAAMDMLLGHQRFLALGDSATKRVSRDFAHSETWALWDVQDMEATFRGPGKLEEGEMVVAEIVGEGNSLSDGRICTDFYADPENGRESVCDVDNWSNNMTGAGGIHKKGAGKLILSGLNTFTGDVLVEDGQLEILEDLNLGTGTLAFAGGTLVLGSGALERTIRTRQRTIEVKEGEQGRIKAGVDVSSGGGVKLGPGSKLIVDGDFIQRLGSTYQIDLGNMDNTWIDVKGDVYLNRSRLQVDSSLAMLGGNGLQTFYTILTLDGTRNGRYSRIVTEDFPFADARVAHTAKGVGLRFYPENGAPPIEEEEEEEEEEDGGIAVPGDGLPDPYETQPPVPTVAISPFFQSFTKPGSGALNFGLLRTSRVVIGGTIGEDDAAALQTLLDAPGGWMHNMRRATGLALQVTIGAQPQAGDILLTDETDARFEVLARSALSNKGVTITNNVLREGYQYTAGRGMISIAFKQNMGGYRGIQALTEMLMRDGLDAGRHRFLPIGTGMDYPDYERRTASIDGGSLLFPVEQLIGIMEQMSLHKMNVLQLRLSANDGFRLQNSNRRLAPPDGRVYSRSDWMQLEEAASRYGIEIIPEIMSPDRSRIWSKANGAIANTGSRSIDIRSSGRRNTAATYVSGIIKQYKDWFKSNKIHIGAFQSDGANTSAHMIAYVNLMYDKLKDDFKEIQTWMVPGGTFVRTVNNAVNKNIVGVIWHSTGSAGTPSTSVRECTTLEPGFRTDRAAGNNGDFRTSLSRTCIPVADGLTFRNWNHLAGGNPNNVDSMLKVAIASHGVVAWRGRKEGGYIAMEGVSEELLSYRVRDRFPYLSGEQALAALVTVSRYRTYVSNYRPRWRGWDTEEMGKALAGPTVFASVDMFVVDLPGEGGRMSASGDFCTDPLSATRPGGVSACDEDTWAQAIGGAGGLHKKGAGKLVLAGANTFSGGLLISGGALEAAADNNLGANSGAIGLDGGTLEFGGVFSLSASRPIQLLSGGGAFDTGGHTITVANVIGGEGGLTKRGLGRLVLGASNTYAGDTVVEGGALQGNVDSIRGDLRMDSPSAMAIFNQAADGIFAGDISGRGVIAKTGAGALMFDGTVGEGLTLNMGGGMVESRGGGFAGDIVFSSLDSVFEFNHSSSQDYSGSVSGQGKIVKSGAGALEVSGDWSGFAGVVDIQEQHLFVTGRMSAAQISVSGGMLGGDGTIAGDVIVRTGATIVAMPMEGSDGGTLSIEGDLSHGTDSVYAIHLGRLGDSLDTGDNVGIEVGGSASLDGVVRIFSDLTRVGRRGLLDSYNILTSAGGISGTYSGIIEDLPFAQAMLAYSDNDVSLFFAPVGAQAAVPVDVDYEDFAESPNSKVFARALTDYERVGGVGDPIQVAMMMLPSGMDPAEALESIPGEVHASVQPLVAAASAAPRNAVASQIRSAFGQVGAQPQAYQDGQDMRWNFVGGSADAPVLWTKGLRSWGNSQDKDGGSRSIEYSGNDVMIGSDAKVGDWRLGVYGGYGDMEFEQNEMNTSGTDRGYHFGLYGGRKMGNFVFRSGLSYVRHYIESSRQLALPGNPALESEYDASTFALFGEISHGYEIEGAGVAIEPYMGLTHVQHSTDEFTEKGDQSLALYSKEGKLSDFSGEFGIRVASDFGGLMGSRSKARGSAVWVFALDKDDRPFNTHIIGDTVSFDAQGIPVSRSKFALELGFDFQPSEELLVSVVYVDGELFGAFDNDQRAVEAKITWGF